MLVFLMAVSNYKVKVKSAWEPSVLPKNTAHYPRPGLEPRPLDPKTSALTMRPSRLPYRIALEICSLVYLRYKNWVVFP